MSADARNAHPASVVVPVMRLSLLDRSRTRSGGADGDALTDTLRRARRAEALGFSRFWVSEHHAVPGIASGAPAVLLAAIGQATQRIRLGSGGVMLPQHQPIIVAEQFRMLEALFPGRIDLGVGRSLGFTAAVRRALRRESATADEFTRDVQELLGFLRDAGPVTVRPKTDPIPVHVLATRSGIRLAARLGLPVVVGGPLVLSPELPRALAEYRASFAADVSAGSGASSSAPARLHVILAIDVFAADDAQQARELALSEAWAMAMSRQTGEFPPLEPPEAIHAWRWPDRVRQRVEHHLAGTITGSVDQVASRLRRLVESTGADEVMATTSTYDVTALGELDANLVRAAEQSLRAE